eukprot:CAMPEP_0119546984 /NCGR_PEP_ID=MMETSP1352-20130426/1208_1 /TAXON_ID=265584 /ORGANISM="Stauroneis constricta, Strain CCMP1120" /LENGTH=346 /DNA_ID=CAMNT_0007591773 /DNA_START=96 /DNA_END=1136 /DNA_ORIENTATION=+
MALSQDFLNGPTFKLMLLAAMVLQNSTVVLVGRYTRSSVPEDELYIVSHLILMTEVGKLLLSFVFEHVTSGGKLKESVKMHILDNPLDAMKIMVPAVLYLVQNTLLYVALSNLTAPMFQVTYQGKLVTTAIVSVLMLNRKYSTQQWVCLVTLSIGVAIVVLGASSDKEEKAASGKQSLVTGLTAVTVACLSSALAGVYFEKVIKSKVTNDNKPPVSVWMRNVQLAFFTICTTVLQSLFQRTKEADAGKGYFHGFTFWAWVLILLQAGGGLLVAAVIKYADNVLKGLATGVSVCVATAASTVFFGTPLSGQFSFGAIFILTSVYFFSNPIKNANLPGATEMRSLLPR